MRAAASYELQPCFGRAAERYPVLPEEMRWARSQSAAGRDLGEVADGLGLLSRELDLHLWTALGAIGFGRRDGLSGSSSEDTQP